MCITPHLFLRVENVSGVVDSGARVSIRPFIYNGSVINYKNTATPEKWLRYKRTDEATYTIGEVKSLATENQCSDDEFRPQFNWQNIGV